MDGRLPAPVGAGAYDVYTGVYTGVCTGGTTGTATGDASSGSGNAGVPAPDRWGLEPPRFCAACGRRMVVQVRPDGWWARCSRHGRVDSQDLEPRR